MQENKVSEDVIEIDLGELFGRLLSKWWIIATSTLVIGVAGFVISSFAMTPKYESTTSIYILSKQNTDTLTYSDAQLSSQLTKDYKKLITGRYVLEQVIEKYELDEKYESFVNRVTVENEADTRIISITVKDVNPSVAQELANEIREVASTHIQSVTDVQAVNVADLANLTSRPAEPSVRLWTVIGAMIGAMISMGIIIIRFMMDDTIKSSEDIEKYLELSTLALVPDVDILSNKKTKKNRSNKIAKKMKPLIQDDEWKVVLEEKDLSLEVIDITDDKAERIEDAGYRA